MKRWGRIASVAAASAILGAAGIERFGFAAPHYRGPVSDHFDGTRFHNLTVTADKHDGALKWMLERPWGTRNWRSWVDEPPGPPPPRRVDGGGLRVTFVNHSTMLVQMDGLNLLTDPIWSERCSPVSFAGPKRHRPPGIRFDDLPPIDVVLLSHNHYDHLDVPTLRRLLAKHAPRIVTALGNGLVLTKSGLGDSTELDWWQATPLSDAVTVTAVPAQHFSSRGVSDRNRNLWCGFVISGPSGHVYFAGDTGWGPHFEQIRQRFSPIRLAMLPIGAYLPRWFMSPVHIGPDQAVEAHLALRASTSVPMHYGTFDLGDDGETQPVEELRAAIAEKGDTKFRVLGFGEGLDVP
jgi:L-ascorbate metabolism protein UlaG (beta-lactamase superfamily)